MRIGLITGEYPPMQGGVGAYTQLLAQHLAAQGHTVFILSSAGTAESDERLSLTTLPNWGLAALVRINQWARATRPDVVSLQFETAAYQMSPWIHFLPHVLPCPVVTTFHDLLFPYLFPKAGRLREWIVMHLARASAGVITTNHEDLERLRHLPCAAMIPIGSNIPSIGSDTARENHAYWRGQAGVREGEFLLAYFGFVNHSKGVDTLLHALALLRTEQRMFRLVMIGGRTGSSDPTNATAANQIDQIITQAGLAPVIHQTGFADDATVSAYLRASDAVVLPYRDGASYRRGSLMAAVAHACVIITTTPQVAIPTFQHGENMVFVPPDDPHALAEQLRLVAADSALRRRLATGAAALAHAFDWDSIAEAYTRFFIHVIETLA